MKQYRYGANEWAKWNKQNIAIKQRNVVCSMLPKLYEEKDCSWIGYWNWRVISVRNKFILLVCTLLSILLQYAGIVGYNPTSWTNWLSLQGTLSPFNHRGTGRAVIQITIMIEVLPPGGESTNKLSVMSTKLANQSKLLRFYCIFTFTIGSSAAYLNHLFPDGLKIGWTQSNLMVIARAFGWRVV